MALLDSNVGHADLTFHNRTSHMVVLGDSRSLAFDRTLTLAVRMLRTLGSVFKHSGKRKQKSIQFSFSPLIINRVDGGREPSRLPLHRTYGSRIRRYVEAEVTANHSNNMREGRSILVDLLSCSVTQAPCLQLYPSRYRADSGLSPLRNVRRRAHHKNTAGAAFLPLRPFLFRTVLFFQPSDPVLSKFCYMSPQRSQLILVVTQFFRTIAAVKVGICLFGKALRVKVESQFPPDKQSQRQDNKTPRIGFPYKIQGREHHRIIPVVYSAGAAALILKYPRLKRTEKQDTNHIAYGIERADQNHYSVIKYSFHIQCPENRIGQYPDKRHK